MISKQPDLFHPLTNFEEKIKLLFAAVTQVGRARTVTLTFAITKRIIFVLAEFACRGLTCKSTHLGINVNVIQVFAPVSGKTIVEFPKFVLLPISLVETGQRVRRDLTYSTVSVAKVVTLGSTESTARSTSVRGSTIRFVKTVAYALRALRMQEVLCASVQKA